MTDSILIVAIAAAIILIVLLGLANWAYRKAEAARTAGYDLGYEDAASAHRIEYEKLQGQMARTTQHVASLNHEREAIMQDAEQRIAIFAGRSYTRDDLATLRRAEKQLKAAALSFSNFPNDALIQQAQFALTVGQQLDAMATRIEQLLDNTKPDPATDAVMQLAEAADSISNGKSWLVYGPERCGKTTNAKAIAAALGLAEIVDDWQPGDPTPTTKTLVLTNNPGPALPFTRRHLSYDQAMALVASKARKEAAV